MLNKDGEAHDDVPDRCEGLEFDAITPDEHGNTFFFKGESLFTLGLAISSLHYSLGGIFCLCMIMTVITDRKCVPSDTLRLLSYIFSN